MKLRIAILILIVSASYVEAQTFLPSADAYIRNGPFANTNYGAVKSVYVKQGTVQGNFKKGYVKFDLTSSGINAISSAKIRLYASTVSAFSVSAFECADNWTESTITWNNAPPLGAVIKTLNVPTANSYYEWDVTAFVQSQLSGDKIVSFAFYDQTVDNKEIRFNTKESTTNKPQLVIIAGSGVGSISSKLNQAITFPNLSVMHDSDGDFNANANASSGLPVSLVSSNTAVATIVAGNIHIVAAGTSVITASQPGDATYNAATSVSKTLTVNSTAIISGLNPFDFVPDNRFGITTTRGIKFADVYDFQGNLQPLFADIYSPARDTTKKRPVILWIHGGGFRTGSVRTQGYIVNFCGRFARRGYVCIAIDYRLRPDSTLPTQASEFPALQDASRDANAAISWVKANATTYKIDPDLIFIAGGSAGGRTAQTVCQFDGPDPTALYIPENQYLTTPWNKTGLIANATLWGGLEPEMRGWVYPSPPYSTANYLQSKDIPSILVHGSADVTILPQNSVDLNNALVAAGVPSELHIIQGAIHGCPGYEAQIADWVATFFAQQWNNKISLRIAGTSPSTNQMHDFMIYPNPLNNSNFSIKLNSPDMIDQLAINLYSLTGQKVYAAIEQSQELIEIKLPNELSKGIYFLELTTPGKKWVQKIIVD